MSAADQAAQEFSELLAALEKTMKDSLLNKNRTLEILRLASGINADMQLLQV